MKTLLALHGVETRREEPMRDFSADHRWLSINTATVRKQRRRRVAAARDHRSLRAARHPRDLAVARPGGRGRPRPAAGSSRRTASSCRAIAAAACSPPTAPAAARDDNLRALDEACELRAPCLVLVVGGLPGALAGRRGTRTSPPRAARCTTASPRCSKSRANVACRWRSSRCIRCTPPTAPASTRSSRRSTCAMRSTRSAPARSAWRSISITSGGTRSCRRRSSAPARDRLLAFHVCDWLVPTTDLLNDRGMMGDGVIDIRRIRGGSRSRRLRRLQRGRDLLERAGGREGRRGARHLHRAASLGGLGAGRRHCAPGAPAPLDVEAVDDSSACATATPSHTSSCWPASISSPNSAGASAWPTSSPE